MTTTKQLTKQDVTKGWLRYYTAQGVINCYERLTTQGFLFGMLPIVEKLYGDDKDQLRKAYLRHLRFYNSEATWGSLIFGIVCSMEEEHANDVIAPNYGGEESDAEFDELINSVKIGLMGPMAGIGDSLDMATVKPIILSLFIPMAAAGSAWAGIGALLAFTIYMVVLAYYLLHRGYSLGRESAAAVLHSASMSKFINTIGVGGMFMMGGLSAANVKMTTKLKIVNDAGSWALQNTLDAIFPKLLPLAAVWLIYYLITKKKVKYTTIVFGIIVISIVCCFFGIM